MKQAHLPPRNMMAPSPPLRLGRAGQLHGRATLIASAIGLALLGLLVASLLGRTEIRSLILLLLCVLGLLCLKPRRGVYILLAFLPFMYFLRRQVLHFNEFASRDPILLFPPIMSIAMFMGVLLFHGGTVVRHIRESMLMKAVVCMLVVFAAQILNPLQGSIFIGLAGAIYFITPMMWAFFGLVLDERDMRRIFALVLFIGVVTALYGIYQHQFGFSQVEKYELESKGFYKLLGTRARVMSTFAGLGDFSLYLCTAGFLAFAHYWRSKGRIGYLAILALVSTGMLWTANRTQIIVLIFSIFFFLVIQPRRMGGLVARGVLILVLVGGLYGYLYTRTSLEIYKSHGSSDPFIAHVVGGLAHPTEESTFQNRLGTWIYVVGQGLLDQPLGRGLGSTTTAAQKFGHGERFEADSYFFEIIYGSSLVAALLFIGLMIFFFRESLPLFASADDPFVHKVVTALVAAAFLGSIFGASVRDTVNGPLVWLLIGWIVKEAVRRPAGASELQAPA